MRTPILLFILSISFIKVFAIDTPTNISPTNGATNISVAPNIDWTAVGGNSGYIYQIDTTVTFDSPILMEGNTAVNTSNANVSSLRFGQTYYWRAATKSAVDTSNWSAVTSFTTQSAITNTSPSNESTNQPININLDWSSIGGNTGYIYQLDTLSTFNSSVYIEGNSTTNYSNINVSSLYFGATYYWRAAAINLVDTSEWSPIWSFTTTDTIYLSSPANEAINQNVHLELDWASLFGSEKYQVELDTSDFFNSTELRINETTNSYFYHSQLLFGQKYYWRVRACHINDTSNWSEIRSFTTTDTIYLSSPANEAINQNVHLELDWASLFGSEEYQVELDTSDFFNSTELRINETTSSYFYHSQLLFGQKYYWRVRASHINDTSNWSEIRSFTTTDTIYLSSPANEAIDQNVHLELDWASLFGSEKYQVELDTSDFFNSTELRINETINSYFYHSQLLFGQKYYWRVRASHIN
ncbi:MAG: hypothetical protein PHW82_16070, partial [Bacteroidales bacterium]|nr:hypothetical protein [Bacteroidales bacterium]